MSTDADDNYLNGAQLDPVMVMGPRAGRMARSQPTEGSVSGADVVATPLAGASGSKHGSDKGPTFDEFVRSPVGWLLVLLIVAYVAFDRVFGA